jgi:hypothetical protein
METGQRGATLRDVRDLCDLYEIGDAGERDRLMTLAREAKQQAWWQRYDLPYSTYVGMEAEAVAISGFQSTVVPGLLQTAEYARAQHEGTMPRLSDDEIDRQIEAKLTRQRLLALPEPPCFNAVLDEAALRRLVGGPKVIAAQLGRLVEAAELPNVTIQVVPFAIGAHPGGESNFTILDMAPPTPGLVFVEGLIGSIYLERPEDLERYHRVFARLQSIALSPAGSIGLIARIRG